MARLAFREKSWVICIYVFIFYFAFKKCSMLFIYGSRKKMIGASDAFLYKCPYCEATNTTTVAIFSKYFHIFFIPAFPFAKEAYASCSNCGAARSDNKFGPELVKQAKEIEPRFKPPFYLYAWLIFLGLLILLILIVAPK